MAAPAAARDGGPGGPRHRVGGETGLAVNPLFPLLALMFGGLWLAWPWFAVNGRVLGGDTFRHQLKLLVGGLVVASLMSIGLMWLLEAQIMTLRAFRYAVIGLVAWKLTISYMILVKQQVAFQIYEYYGGQPRNGIAVAIAGLFLKPYVIEAIPEGWWIFVLV